MSMTVATTEAPELRSDLPGHQVPGSSRSGALRPNDARSRTGRAHEGLFVGLAVLVVYSVVAYALDFRSHVYPPDAVSRMANGFYVLYSRHPHLAAIGFVW